MIDATDVEAQSVEAATCNASVIASRRAGRWSSANYGIGGLIAVAVWSELGDCRRFSRSEQVVRHTGLDVTVDSSDRHRAGGYLTRQGPPTLRWALFEAAMNASHRRSPDHAYYTDGEGSPRRQAGRHLRGPPARPALLPHPAQRSIPTSSTRCRPDLPSAPAAGIAHTNITGLHRGQLLQPACPPASVLDGLLTLTRPRSQPTGDTQSRLLSPTTQRSSST